MTQITTLISALVSAPPLRMGLLALAVVAVSAYGRRLTNLLRLRHVRAQMEQDPCDTRWVL
jgi:hypothetical protein